MKYIITESQINRFILKYLNSEYGDLEPYETDKNHDLIFFIKDGKVIFDYNKTNGEVYISYEDVWSLLESVFGFAYWEIQDITKTWVEEHYNLNVTTTLTYEGSKGPRWRNITN